MGSVKDLEVLKRARGKKEGVGRFTFSNRYSVFDWGEMPDHILHKGAALCLMGAHCLEQVEKKGIKTHYRGLVGKKGKLLKTKQVKEPIDVMEIDLVRIFKPKFARGKYNYSAYRKKLVNCLLPLEVIYRNGLPEGSSVFRRLESGDLTLQDLGFKRMPKPGQKFKKPFFDVSTKLEEKDRYLSWAGAKRISGLKDDEVKKMKKVLLTVNRIISQVAAKVGLVNEDGKIELGFNGKRKLMLVDVIGTLDECRFTYKGKHVSKEIARQFYKTTKWYQDVEKAKKIAAEKEHENWKELCKSQPKKLNPELKKIISHVYAATANAFLGRNVFKVPKLVKVMKKYTAWLYRFEKSQKT